HQGGRGSGDRRPAGDAQDGGHGSGGVPEATGPGGGGGQHRRAAAGRGPGRDRGGPGVGQAGEQQGAHEGRGGSVRADQGGGRPAHAVLQQLPAAVLLPDDGRDGRHPAARGRGDGHAGRQRDDFGGADYARRPGGRAAVRGARRRPHRGRRRRQIGRAHV